LEVAGISYRDVHGIAEELGVDVQTVRRWIQSGRLRAFKPGKEYRVREADLEEFLAAREVRPKAPRRSPFEPSFNDVLASERRYRPTAQDVQSLDRYLSRLRRELDENRMRQADVLRELDIIRAFGPAVCASMSGETADLIRVLGRRLLEKAKELKIRDLAEAEAGVARLEEWREHEAS
jgi:excisionase family DNA binding protein